MVNIGDIVDVNYVLLWAVAVFINLVLSSIYCNLYIFTDSFCENIYYGNGGYSGSYNIYLGKMLPSVSLVLFGAIIIRELYRIYVMVVLLTDLEREDMGISIMALFMAMCNFILTSAVCVYNDDKNAVLFGLFIFVTIIDILTYLCTIAVGLLLIFETVAQIT